MNDRIFFNEYEGEEKIYNVYLKSTLNYTGNDILFAYVHSKKKPWLP